MAKVRRKGRRQGSRNRGYFFREGRGWGHKDKEGRFIALKDESGGRLRDPQASDAAKLAHARWLTAEQEKPAEPTPAESGASLVEACTAYLAKAQEQKGRNKTFSDRAEILFNFTHGLPARFLSVNGKPKAKPKAADYIHPGYGAWPVSQLKKLDIDRWLAANPGWKSSSTKRGAVKAVIRALNYSAGAGLVPANPIKGYSVPKGTARVTYITPEQEAALLKAASPALAMSLKVLIRTGMRPGIEFAAITARHIKDDGQRIEIIFQPNETKTGRLRTIYVTDPEILEIIRGQVAANPRGAIFRTPRGAAWNQSNLSKRFRDIRDKLIEGGMEFDRDCVLYSTRHTYAKRILEGVWTGKPTNLQTLSRLMGNSVKICMDHYTKWDKSSTEFLWANA
ncbi:MAG TPA: hypothetical protein VHY91_05855 [Pirellulales bacterium]|jgi:integrase|nr:hypothetical protein [Pirellulales bacterium]